MKITFILNETDNQPVENDEYNDQIDRSNRNDRMIGMMRLKLFNKLGFVGHFAYYFFIRFNVNTYFTSFSGVAIFQVSAYTQCV